jgi:hypothetical protein
VQALGFGFDRLDLLVDAIDEDDPGATVADIAAGCLVELGCG